MVSTAVGLENIHQGFEFTVSSTLDTVDANPGDGIAADSLGRATLRAAIMEANSLPGSHRIVLAGGLYTLTRAGANENAALTGDLDITGDITIVDQQIESTVIDGGDLDRVFHVLPSGKLTVTSITIQNRQRQRQWRRSFQPGKSHVAECRAVGQRGHGGRRGDE